MAPHFACSLRFKLGIVDPAFIYSHHDIQTLSPSDS